MCVKIKQMWVKNERIRVKIERISTNRTNWSRIEFCYKKHAIAMTVHSSGSSVQSVQSQSEWSTLKHKIYNSVHFSAMLHAYDEKHDFILVYNLHKY